MGAARTFDLADLLGFVSLWFRAWRSKREDPADVPGRFRLSGRIAASRAKEARKARRHLPGVRQLRAARGVINDAVRRNSHTSGRRSLLAARWPRRHGRAWLGSAPSSCCSKVTISPRLVMSSPRSSRHGAFRRPRSRQLSRRGMWDFSSARFLPGRLATGSVASLCSSPVSPPSEPFRLPPLSLSRPRS